MHLSPKIYIVTSLPKLYFNEILPDGDLYLCSLSSTVRTSKNQDGNLFNCQVSILGVKHLMKDQI